MQSHAGELIFLVRLLPHATFIIGNLSSSVPYRRLHHLRRMYQWTVCFCARIQGSEYGLQIHEESGGLHSKIPGVRQEALCSALRGMSWNGWRRR